MEDVQEQVHKEIANNANAVEFPDAEVVADTQAVEVEGQQTVPDFMQNKEVYECLHGFLKI